MAQSDFPDCKFRFFPQWSLWFGGGGGLLLRCTAILILPSLRSPHHRRSRLTAAPKTVPLPPIRRHAEVGDRPLLSLGRGGGGQGRCHGAWSDPSPSRHPQKTSGNSSAGGNELYRGFARGNASAGGGLSLQHRVSAAEDFSCSSSPTKTKRKGGGKRGPSFGVCHRWDRDLGGLPT